MVKLNLADKKYQVGELILRDKQIFFKYDREFIANGLELSPFKLPLSESVKSPATNIFSGLFGLFADSLPDGWGRLLIDRALTSKGIMPGSINILDRLAIVGNSGPGALSYHPINYPDLVPIENLELDLIAEEARKIWSGEESVDIDGLAQLGGSSGGARPKILVGYNMQKDHIIPFSPILPNGYSHWIIKFPAPNDPPEIGQIEMAYHRMAVAAGIKMSECRLFAGQHGQLYFGTKRFDRIENNRQHLHSVAGLLHDNFRLSSLDYGHLMDAAFRLERHTNAYRKILRLAAFNIFAHNRDDHSKNFSFLMNNKGKWQFAPAYDLTYSNTAHGHHSTTIAGESKHPGKVHLLELAKVFGIDEASEIIAEVRDSINKWETYAQSYGVGVSVRKEIRQMLNIR